VLRFTRPFRGDDETRALAFLDIANDESFAAVWFARGGYGACRVVEAIMDRLKETAGRKTWGGYSDAGMLLAALYRPGWGVAHGPVAQDILRDEGDTAWMIDRTPARWSRRRPRAQNSSIQHDGTEPFARHAAATRPVLMLEEVRSRALTITRRIEVNYGYPHPAG
jgi:muramoyltetrapeptide carboxypeptidase